MKKYLLLMLLTPLAYAEVQEFYCEASVFNFLTLKVDADVNNPIFRIEDAYGRFNDNKDFDKDDINIQRLILKVSDDDNQNLYLFNRVTSTLLATYNSAKKNKYLMWKEDFLNSDYHTPGNEKEYTCIEYK